MNWKIIARAFRRRLNLMRFDRDKWRTVAHTFAADAGRLQISIDAIQRSANDRLAENRALRRVYEAARAWYAGNANALLQAVEDFEKLSAPPAPNAAPDNVSAKALPAFHCRCGKVSLAGPKACVSSLQVAHSVEECVRLAPPDEQPVCRYRGAEGSCRRREGHPDEHWY